MKSIFRFFVIISIIGFAFISCPEPTPPALTGSVSITGTTQEGQILTANISNLGGSGVITFQWIRSGSTIIGSNNSAYTVQAADVGSTISVTVTRSDNSGSITSEPTAVIIAVPVITINTQPIITTNLTAGSISGSLTVSASVTAGATLSYQWYSNTTNINISGTVISGANNASYAIPTTLTTGTYYYFCEVRATNGAVSVRSNVSAVTVTTLPVITINTQPAATTNVTVGNISGSLSVTANVTAGSTLSYQWYSNTTNNNTNGTIINEATNANYTILTTLTAGTYYYFCEVNATNGAVSVRSNVSTVNVTVPVITINTQPTAAVNVIAGNISGNLSVGASVTGNATLSYQWYSNTTNSNTSGTVISEATNASYAIPTTLTAGTYYYFCEVRATGGATSVRSNVSTVTVAIRPVITINTQPTASINFVAGCINGSLSVAASVTQGATLSYQWYSNTVNNNTDGTIISGATNASYTIPTTLTAGTYYYYCQVSATGDAALVLSNIARVYVIANDMVWVPSGSFELGKNLGTDSGSDETPVSTVNISGFYIGKYQVTQELYQAVIGTNPSWFHGDSEREPAAGEVQEKRPVESVNWYNTIVFCNRLSIMEGLTPAYILYGSTNPDFWGTVPTSNNVTWNAVQIVSGSTGYRLPTEAQWEYVAKGGNGSPGNFIYSGSNAPDVVAWYSANSESRTHEVGKKAPNGLGIYDMSGNVNEWCWDWVGNYTSEQKSDPTGAPSGTIRVLRGGGWYDYHSTEYLRSVYRSNAYPEDRGNGVGFRVSRP
ncbi:MAG: formylglycine-generating enzyme family protein [Treponema sp.]|nr:formylglycine-generating enzyme family protein [Treponema sp.]